MAICLEGYSSHCSFMERHKALVAACDILKSTTEVLVSERGSSRARGPHGRTEALPYRTAGSTPRTNQMIRGKRHTKELLSETSE